MGVLDLLMGGGGGADAAREANERNRALFEGIDLPEYAELIPELYNSESYNHQLIAEDPMLKSKQMGNLNMLEQLANEGLSAEDELGFMKARDLGAQSARGGTQAALADAAARGVSGGGLEFAMREQANQGGAQRSQQAGLEQAAAAARQRALQAQAYQNALSQSRGDDYRVNSANTNIVNDFNTRNTSQRNAVSAANVDKRDDAFRYNEGNKDKKYGNEMRRADSIAGVNNRSGEIGLAEDAAQREGRRAILGAGASLAGGWLGGK